LEKKVRQYKCEKCNHEEFDFEHCCKSCEDGNFDFEVKYYITEKKYQEAIIKLCFDCQEQVKKHINTKGKEKNDFVSSLISEYEIRKKVQLKEWENTESENED